MATDFGNEIEGLFQRAERLRNDAQKAVNRAKLRAETAKNNLNEAQKDLNRIEDIVEACRTRKRVSPPQKPRKRSRYWGPDEETRLEVCAEGTDRSLPHGDFWRDLQRRFGNTRTVASIKYKASSLGIRPK